MSTVEAIEDAIRQLAPQDYARVRDWFLERDNQLWSTQIESDSAAGRLDCLVKEIEGDIAAGRTKPLNELINGS